MHMNWSYYAEIVWKMLTVIVLLLIYTRMSGSRRLAPVTVFDNISNLVVGAIAGTTLLNQNVKALDLGVFMAIWILLLISFRFLRKHYPWVRILLDGAPIELIKHGHMHAEAFRKAGLSPTSFQSMLRSQGISGPHVVDSAIFERSGQLSVSQDGEDQFSVILVDRGQIKDESLARIGYTEDWLHDRLADLNAPTLDKIFCAEWDGSKLWLYFYDDVLIPTDGRR